MECFLWRKRGPFPRNPKAWIPVSGLLLGGSLLTLAFSLYRQRGQVWGQEPLQFLPESYETMDVQIARESSDRDWNWADTGIKQTSQVPCLRTKTIIPWLGKTFLVSCSIGLNTSISFKGSTVAFFYKILPDHSPIGLEASCDLSILFIHIFECLL